MSVSIVDPIASLTHKEIQVLILAARGSRNAEIAERLGICVKTVESRFTTLFKKLGVRSRLEAVVTLQSSPLSGEVRGGNARDGDWMLGWSGIATGNDGAESSNGNDSPTSILRSAALQGLERSGARQERSASQPQANSCSASAMGSGPIREDGLSELALANLMTSLRVLILASKLPAVSGPDVPHTEFARLVHDVAGVAAEALDLVAPGLAKSRPAEGRRFERPSLAGSFHVTENTE